MISAAPTLRDPISLEVFRNAMTGLADEMAITVLRTAHSQIIAESIDFSCALCDAGGLVLAQSNCNAVHMGAVPDAVEAVISKFEGAINRGDIYLLNDPDEGGMHLPDLFVIQPVFSEATRVAFSVCMAHHVDIGGRVPGGNAVDSTEIFQEGLQIPLLKLYDRGAVNETFMSILKRNVRPPDLVLGDLMAEVTACRTGQQGILRLVERHGVAGFEALAEDLLNYSERLIRGRLGDIPDGVYEFEDYLDDDGMGSDEVPLRVRLEVSGSELHVDFTGSSPQVRSSLNCTPSATKSSAYGAIQAALGGDIPANSGFYRPIRFTIPEASILNGRRPVARAARGLTCYRILDTVFGALAQILPDRIPAAGDGGPNGVSIGSTDESGQPFVLVDVQFGAWGARPDRDGVDGISPLLGNLANTPIEELERTHIVRVLQYEFVPDSGGAGRWRGGLSIARDLQLLQPESAIAIRSDRRKRGPYGLSEGCPGGRSWNILDPGPGQKVLPSKTTTSVQSMQVVRHITAGGGGHGNPLDRDPLKVVEDVLDEKVSRRAAQRVYGVVVAPDDSLDLVTTRRIRARRGGRRTNQ